MEFQKLFHGHSELEKLFQKFSDEDMEKIQVSRYPQDVTMIKREAQTSDYAYLIVTGICGIFNILENGEEYCYYKISEYDVIGLSELLGEQAISREADIRTLTAVVALKISKEDLRKWMVQYPEFYNRLVRKILNRLHGAIRKYIECKKYSSIANIVSYLIYSYELYRISYEKNFVGDVKINETREMIGDFISMSIRSVNYNLEALKKLDYINIRRGKIYINHEQYMHLRMYKEELLME
jgi:CRP-like cAMP-binding protein